MKSVRARCKSVSDYRTVFRKSLISFALVAVLLLGSLVLPGPGVQEANAQITGSSFGIFVEMNYKSKEEFSLEFTMNWGPFEYEKNKVFQPTASYLAWEELQSFAATNSTQLDILRNTPFPGTSHLIFSEPNFFVRTVLGGDFLSGDASFKPIDKDDIPQSAIAYYSEFDELVITLDVVVEESSYTIRPLSFVYGIFDFMLPETRVVIRASPSVTLQSSGFNLYHYMVPDGEFFTSEDTLGLGNKDFIYSVEEDEISISETPVLTAATLFYLFVFFLVVSFLALALANRKSRYKVPRGFFLWVKVFVIYFLAFLPFHFYLTVLLMVVVFLYLLKKAGLLRKIKKEDRQREKATIEPSSQEADPVVTASEGSPQRAQPGGGTSSSPHDDRGFLPSTDEINQLLFTPEAAHLAPPITSPTLSLRSIEASGEIAYLGDKLGFVVKVKNGLPMPIRSVTVKPFLNADVYQMDAEQKEIPEVGSGQLGQLVFDLYPKGLVQNIIVSGVLTFHDTASGQYQNVDLSPVQTDIVIPELYATPIDLNTFKGRVTQMYKISEKIENVALPVPVFHELVKKSLEELNFFKVPEMMAGPVGPGMFQQAASGQSWGVGQPGASAGRGGPGNADEGSGFTHRYFAETSFKTAVALESAVSEMGPQNSGLYLNIWSTSQKDLTLFYNIILFKLWQSIQSTKVEDYQILEKTAKVEVTQEKADVQNMMTQLQQSVQQQLRLFSTAMMKGGSRDDIFKEIYPFHVKDLFLIEKRGGRLMKHLSMEVEKGQDIDKDVVSSMFTAIQDFIGDSFRGGKGQTLNELKYGDSNILIEHSEDVFLAVVATGEPPGYIRLRMADVINNVSVSMDLSHWDGDSSSVGSIVPVLQGFIEECEKEQEKKDYTKALEALESARETAEDLQEDKFESPEGKRFLTIAKVKFKNGQYVESIQNSKLAIKAMKKDRKDHKKTEVTKSVGELENKVEALLQKIGTKQSPGGDAPQEDDVIELDED